MNEAVTDVIVARSRDPQALRSMIVWSVAAHAVVVAAVLMSPAHQAPPPPQAVMTISLGGSPGPKTGGLTQAGGRAVQEVAPPAPPVRRAETAPAPVPPKMTLPDPKARTRPTPKPAQVPPDATSRKPTEGEKPEPGSTPTQSRVRGQGFGLSSAGGAGSGVTVDVQNFCCPEYLDLMVEQIKRNWVQNQGVVGVNTMKFTINRDGTLVGIQLEKPSGITPLDLESQRALVKTQKVSPLPTPYSNQTLGVHLEFRYER